MIGALKTIFNRLEEKELHNSKIQSEEAYLVNHDYPEISKEEFCQIQQTWPYMRITKRDLTWFRIYKKEHGFSPFFVGVWQSHLIRQVFNPYAQLSSFDNKALCDVYFPELPFPRAYLRRLQGIYYDHDMRVITENEAIELLKSVPSFFIKPAFGTMQGSGVHKVTLTGNYHELRNQIIGSFRAQKADFIVQEVLNQYPTIAMLNPSSINCCRVTTIYINGKFDYSTIIKIGRKGSSVDNWHSSVLGGVTKDGVLLNIAYDNQLNRTDRTDNGHVFGGIRLPRFKEMIDLVERSHKKLFPNCGIIGWDVFVDNNENIRIIESNITFPGFVGEQLASGTFFESFRDDINERIKRQLRR